MSGRPWTDEQLDWIVAVIRRSRSLVDACATVAQSTGRPLSSTNLTRTFLSRGRPRPVEYVGLDLTTTAPPLPERPAKRDPRPSVDMPAAPPAPTVAPPEDPVERHAKKLDATRLRREHEVLI